MFERLSPTQSNILLALGIYKFLTSSQFLALGISTQKTNLSKNLSYLRERKRPLIKRNQFGFHPRKGRLEDIYYLHHSAKKLLAQHMASEDIKIPIGRSTLFSQDYFHRKNTIDCEIYARLAAQQKGYEILFFDRYFDKTSNGKRGGNKAKTKIQLDGANYIIADGIFMREKQGQKELYCLEMYNGKDTKRVIQQLHKHLKAIELGTPSTMYDFPKGNRVLSVFEHRSIKEATIKRLQTIEVFSNFTKHFLFKDLAEIKDDFFAGWQMMS